MCRFVARLFQGEFTLPQPFRTGPLAILNQLQCRLNSQRRDRTQHFRRHRRIDAHIAERDALLVAGVVHFGIADITSIAPRMVQYLELASAVPATDQSNEKPPPLRTEPATIVPFILALPEIIFWLRSYSSHEM